MTGFGVSSYLDSFLLGKYNDGCIAFSYSLSLLRTSFWKLVMLLYGMLCPALVLSREMVSLSPMSK